MGHNWPMSRHPLQLGLGVLTALAVAFPGTVPASAAATGPLWPMYHLDPARTGLDTLDPGLDTPSPAWTSPLLDGAIRAEPVYANNLLLVVTENNTVYALDPATGAATWSTHFDIPVPKSKFPVNCGNIDPLGMTGTPVIDPARGTAGTLFVLEETYDGANTTSINHQLIGVDLATHAATTKVNADPPGVTSGDLRGVLQQRSALALSAGRVIVDYGGLSGDCGNYHGWAVSLAEDGTGTVYGFEASASTRGSGMWAPSGPAMDAAGNLYVSTGNGFESCSANPPYEYADGVIKLSPTMQVLDYFAPTTWCQDDAIDADLGSMGPSLLDGNLVFQLGKQQVGYLLNKDNLGHLSSGAFHATACDQLAFGGNAYISNAGHTGGMLFVPCREGLRRLDVTASPPSFSRVWLGPADATGPPIVAGGLIWVHGNSRLYGLDPATGSAVRDLGVSSSIYNFATPTAAGNHLFISMDSRIVAWQGATSATGGVVVDGYGGLHPYGTKAFDTSGGPYWAGFDIARGVTTRPDGSGGYVLDGWGGVHRFGAAAPISDQSHAYWQGWDIARGVGLCGNGSQGYVVDGYGGINAFGGAPPVANNTHAYWSGWDIARGIAVKADCSGGYTLDGWGGVHNFGNSPAVADTSHAYWRYWDIARGIVLRPDGVSGWVLDGYGGINAFGGAPAVANSTHAYWSGWDIANGITLNAGGLSGYTLDGWGGVHSWTAPGGVSPPPVPDHRPDGYWQGWDIARGISGS